MMEDKNRIDALYEQIEHDLRKQIRVIIQREKVALAEGFYTVMLSDPDSAPYLEATTVKQRLKPSMASWLEQLLCSEDSAALTQFIAMQRHVGEVHARAQIPVNLVLRGMQWLKQTINRHLQQSSLQRDELVSAVLHVYHLFDIAFEAMSDSYVYSHDKGIRVDESFKLFASGHNMATERERQLGAVLDWESRLFRELAIELPLRGVVCLRASSFGLWLNHKASLVFDEERELSAISQSIDRIDKTLLPQLASAKVIEMTQDSRRILLRTLQHEIEQIKFLLGDMFDRANDLEVGRDALTQLFNRRYLPSILKREIELSRRKGLSFAVVMLDVDHFKQVNDTHGHDGGDLVLQQVATLMTNRVRSGDFVFRYGGEEFLLLLTEVEESQALKVAEKLRVCIAETRIMLPAGKAITVTASLGLALSDGHPDYERTIQRADAALYEAKNSGRNRVVLA